jgi:hypothetical protein
LGAIADALSPDTESGSAASPSTAGCLLAPRWPSVARSPIRGRSDEQAYKELSALSACLMEPLATLLLNSLYRQLYDTRAPAVRMPPLPAAGTPAATPAVPNASGAANERADAAQWLARAAAALEAAASDSGQVAQVPAAARLLVEPFLRASACALWRCHGELFEKQVRFSEYVEAYRGTPF